MFTFWVVGSDIAYEGLLYLALLADFNADVCLICVVIDVVNCVGFTLLLLLGAGIVGLWFCSWVLFWMFRMCCVAGFRFGLLRMIWVVDGLG